MVIFIKEGSRTIGKKVVSIQVEDEKGRKQILYPKDIEVVGIQGEIYE